MSLSLKQPGHRGPAQRRAGGLFLLTGSALSVLLVAVSASLAGTVIEVVPPSFGEIDLHPAGDTVTIAAQNGPAMPSVGRSAITGGGSGRIVLSSVDAEVAEVVYPESLTLTSGSDSVIIRDIPALSQTTAGLTGGGARVELSIGGRLELRDNQRPGNYSGTMIIQVNY